MTSYHWNAGYRETRELPSPKTHTGWKRGEHKERKKRLLTCIHTDLATAVKRNSAKLIHTPMQGQTKHAWVHKDKTSCAVGQAAQATLRKRGTVWTLFRDQDHTVTFSFTREVLWSTKQSFNPASVQWQRCEHKCQQIRGQPSSVERLRRQAKGVESYDTLIYIFADFAVWTHIMHSKY